ncbi:MAG: hypothetical protein ABI065_08650 [Terrimesophilobacter sp.]
MSMLVKFGTRGAALFATLALLGGTVWVAAGTTGAYFSDTHSGTVAGTVGAIAVTPYGGSGDTHMDLSFDRLLPGEPQTVTVNYQNTGDSAEDVWIVFNNATALSALNNLGTYGHVNLSANNSTLFNSSNLNDRVETCGTLAPNGCWPLAKQYRVASSVAPGATGNISFTFALASKTVTRPDHFNVYPASEHAYLQSNNWNDQRFIDPADGSGNGLPYQIVATQKGVTP